MTITKTLGPIVVQNTVSIAQTLVVSDDPTFVGDLVGNSSAGQQWRMDDIVGPLVTKPFQGALTLVAGELTLDLTALTDSITGPLDMSGLKLRLLHLRAPSTNVGPITIEPGASDAYDAWGLGEVVSPGDQRGPGIFTGGIAVDATHKELDLSGTGTDQLIVIMGFGP